MLIPKGILEEAKDKLGEKAAFIIAKDLNFSIDEKNLKASCPFHKNDSTPSLIWNTKGNYWKCFGCGKHVDIVSHYMDFHKLTFLNACEKLFQETGINFKFSEKDVKIKREYKYPKREENIYRDDVEEYMDKRKISTKTADYCDVQQDKNNNVVFHYYDTNDVLMLVKYRPARILKDGEIKTWCQKDADTTPLLYNMNKIDTTKPLVLTEGEWDCLAVIESGWSNVVSVPFGANNYNWIEENDAFLSQFDKIIVWSDGDDAGIKMRNEVITRLGTYRCFYVDCPKEVVINGKTTNIKDANEVLFYIGKEKVISLIENASEVPVINVKNLSDVKPLDLSKVGGVKSGIKQLDEWINKFYFGTIAITTGSSGSGKSVWLNQIYAAEALNQGYKTFIMSGELTIEQLQYWINLALAGVKKIEQRENHQKIITKDSLKKIKNWYDDKLFVYDNETDYTATTILKTMEDLVRKKGVKVFILDNLMTIDLECNHNDIWMRQKQFVVRLINFARKYGVLIHLIAHPRKLETTRRLTKYDVSGSGDITNLAHYVIGLHRLSQKEKEGKKDRKGEYIIPPINFDCVLDLFKNRFTGIQDVELGICFDKTSYRFYTTDEELNKKYDWDDTEDDDELPSPINDALPSIFQK